MINTNLINSMRFFNALPNEVQQQSLAMMTANFRAVHYFVLFANAPVFENLDEPTLQACEKCPEHECTDLVFDDQPLYRSDYEAMEQMQWAGDDEAVAIDDDDEPVRADDYKWSDIPFVEPAASNVAANNAVANNQCVDAEAAESSSAAASPQDPQQADNAAAPHPQVEPHKASHVATASAYPDGHNNEAAEVAEVAAEVEKEAVTNVCDTAVRCRARGQVWLDMECMEQDELRELMPALKPAQLEEMLPRDEFRRGCTLNGVQAELLKPEVLNVEPPTCSDVPVRYFHMMNAVRRLIDSRRCLLFEQVRVMVNYDFTDEIFKVVCDFNSTAKEREEFMAKSRHERIHIIAHVWARMAIFLNMIDETASASA